MTLYLAARAKSEYIYDRLTAGMWRGHPIPLISHAARGSADSALEPILTRCA